MPHWLALVPGSSILAMVDPGYPASPIPITAKCSPVDGQVPASTLPWSWPGLVQTWTTLPGAGMTPELEAKAGAELDWRTSEPPPLAYEPPAGMVPYHWQDSAARRFALGVAQGFRGQLLLSDDMGTGKSATVVLSLVESHLRTLSVFPVLVVCPASVIPAWLKTWRDWAPDYRVADHRGPKRWDRLKAEHVEVLVTSYETMARDVDKLGALGVTSAVFDEHHAIKNSQSKRTQAARSIARRADHVIGMSGTPIAHGPDDLHPMLAALDEAAWPSKERYVSRYCDVVPDEVGGTVAVGLRADRRSELDLCLAGVQRRVTKAEAAPFLPPKVYTVRTVTMPKDWRETYVKLEEEMIAQLPEDGAELSPMSVLAQMSQLQALASAPCNMWEEPVLDRDGEPVLTVDGVPKITQHVDPLPGGWKAAELLALLEETQEQVVVFAPSRKLIDAVAVDLDGAGVSYRLLTGAVTAAKRQAGIDDFQAGRARVMLATTGAGGVGVTLTAASIVVFLARPWSLIEALQAEDRAHRIGSEVHSRIEIVDIVTEGTIEAAVRRVLVDKAMSLADVLHDPEIARQVLGGKAIP